MNAIALLGHIPAWTWKWLTEWLALILVLLWIWSFMLGESDGD